MDTSCLRPTTRLLDLSHHSYMDLFSLRGSRVPAQAVNLISFRSRPLRCSSGTKGSESLSHSPVSRNCIILIPFVSSRRRVIFPEQLRQSQKYSGVLNRKGDPT